MGIGLEPIEKMTRNEPPVISMIPRATARRCNMRLPPVIRFGGQRPRPPESNRTWCPSGRRIKCGIRRRRRFCLVLMALPLLIPWNVVGAMWNIFALPEIGLLGHTLNAMGIDYNFTRQPVAAWMTTVVMDVWHWTSLIVLLCYAGLSSISDDYYQAAHIDGASRWAIFRYIQLPKMKRVLTIAILLRFMDSFMIYTEPFVLTGGGPGNTTTFLSIDLVKIALGQFDLGPAAAMSLIYFLMVLLICWAFYTIMMRNEEQ